MGMANPLKYVSGFAILLFVVRSGVALRCLECDDMPQPYDCNVVTTCSPGSSCFLTQYVTTSGNVLYRQGCMTNQRCSSRSLRSLLMSYLVQEESSTDIEICTECCSTTNCNNHGCFITGGVALRCLECDDMPQPYDCNVVTTCSPGSSCFLTQYVTTSGNALYRQGCMSNQRCSSRSLRSLLMSYLVQEESSTDIETCTECCSTTNCNNHGCFITVPDRLTRGPFCYTCDAQAEESSCRTVTECELDEVCYIETRTAAHTIGFQSRCIAKSQCGGLLAGGRQSVNTQFDRCPLCCENDFCNDNCLHNITTVTTTTTNPPVDGQWSLWSPWGPCSVSCGQGTQTRIRVCDQPAPQHSGHNCTGDITETQSCQGQSNCIVPVDGQWSLWSPWGPCTVTCGQGTKTRLRVCDQPALEHGGHDCSGNASETQTCDSQSNCPVPVNGEWSEWSPWSSCNVTCGHGTKTRSRACDQPAPQHGGQFCPGNATEKQTCDTQKLCPVDGQWGEWGSWSPCSHTCDYGNKERQRSCSSPAPSGGGQDCHGLTVNVEICKIEPCTRAPGYWSQWSEWSQCSTTCGTQGTMTRTRHCINPEGGPTCDGDNTTSNHCSHTHCPVGGCDIGYTFYNTIGCVRLVKEPHQNYTVATKMCNSEHAHLIVIHSEAEQNQVVQMLKRGNAHHTALWMGLHLSTDHVWQWVWPKDQPLVTSNYSVLFVDKYQGNCTVIDGDNWVSNNCSTTLGYICQKPSL